MKFHGLIYKKDSAGHPGSVRFGFLRLCHLLNGYFCLPKSAPEEKRPVWKDKWFDRRFHQAIKKYQETYWKIDRVADLLNQAIEKVATNKDSRDMENYAQFRTAITDITIHLDSLLLYLRSQAGCISDIIPYFYGQKGKTIPCSEYKDNFRDQRNWFLTKRKTFDKKYSAIVSTKMNWFDTLSADDRSGLREIIAHYRGTYQIGWSDDKRTPFDLKVSLFNERGFASEHLIPQLKKLITEYYEYLDSTYAHYFRMMKEKFGKGFFDDIAKLSHYYTFDKVPSSSWIYPQVNES